MDLLLAGCFLCGVSIIGGSMLLSAKITAKSHTDRTEIEHHFEDRIRTARREADSWRKAYEDMRAERDSLQTKVDIQTMILNKTKLKDTKKESK